MIPKRLPARRGFVLAAIWLTVLPGVLSLSLSAQFLVRDQQYRCPASETACHSPHQLSDFEQRPLTDPRYSVNYVEFDDHGGFWDPLELTDALDQIRKAPDNGRSTILVVYINGWKNNADIRQCAKPPCGDVDKFRDTLLARLAEQHPHANVVGVYLGWRGLTLNWEPFKTMSYWPRRTVARVVGQTGISQTLSQIDRIVAPRRDRYFFVLAGHSFGARVLENAADAAATPQQHEGFMTAYIRQQASSTEPPARVMDHSEASAVKRNTGMPVDLIVYLNAATANTVTRRTLKQIDALCTPKNSSSEICSTDPFYLAVTSRVDLATGIIMPIANAVFPALASDGFHLISAANTPWLHTHHDPRALPQDALGCPSAQSKPVAGICFAVGPPKTSVTFEVAPIAGKTQPQFWIFNVRRKTIGNHGDVWNPAVTSLVSAVLLRNERLALLERQSP